MRSLTEFTGTDGCDIRTAATEQRSVIGAKSFIGSYGILSYTNWFVYDKMPYDPINDFAPITLLCSVAAVLMSHPSVPVNSVKDLIAFARSKPDALTYATAGPASN